VPPPGAPAGSGLGAGVIRRCQGSPGRCGGTRQP
jgi:hypothetical protein